MINEENEENVSTKNQITAYAVCTLSLDPLGIWHAHFYGHKGQDMTEFGDIVLSDRNIRQLLNKVGSKLNNVKDLFSQSINIEEVKRIKGEQDEDAGA